MAKKNTDSVAGEAAPKADIVHIERGPWDIDPATVIDVQELSPAEVMVVTSGNGSYRLTREEAAPFLS